MIAGDIVAPVSEVTGTRTCAAYSLQIRELKYNVHDTPGIQGRKLGTVTKYISSLPDGVGLLVFCMRGRITEDAVAIYQHFSRVLHGVPAVVVITGLEHEDPMQSWWTNNQAHFVGYGMSFKGSACVTTQRGKRSMFATQYEDSKKSVEALIATYFNQEVVSFYIVLAFHVLTWSQGIAHPTGTFAHNQTTAPQTSHHYSGHRCLCRRRHHHRCGC